MNGFKTLVRNNNTMKHLFLFLTILACSMIAFIPLTRCEAIATPSIKSVAPANEPSPLRQYGGSVTRALLIVTSILIIGVRFYKAYTLKQERPQERIQIKSRRNLSPRTQLLIIDVDNDEYLLSVTPDQISMLSKLERVSTSTFERVDSEMKSLDFSQVIAKRMGEG